MNNILKMISKMESNANEVKLAKHEVELGLAEDLDKINNNILGQLKTADNAWRSYQDYLSKASTPFKKMIELRRSLLDSISKIELLLKNAEVKAKDLGLDVKSIPMYAPLKKNIQTANEIVKTIDTFEDPSTFQ